MGVKKIMEKIHDKGKYMVGGDFFGRFGKIQHTFQGFFPGLPLHRVEKNILMRAAAKILPISIWFLQSQLVLKFIK